jgi:hypothetical protein
MISHHAKSNASLQFNKTGVYCIFVARYLLRLTNKDSFIKGFLIKLIKKSR